MILYQQISNVYAVFFYQETNGHILHAEIFFTVLNLVKVSTVKRYPQTSMVYGPCAVAVV